MSQLKLWLIAKNYSFPLLKDKRFQVYTMYIPWFNERVAYAVGQLFSCFPRSEIAG